VSRPAALASELLLADRIELDLMLSAKLFDFPPPLPPTPSGDQDLAHRFRLATQELAHRMESIGKEIF
jgi:hypothetical protein